MKKVLYGLLIVLMLSVLVVPAALAVDPTADPAYSSIQVLNLDTTDTTDALITIYYYNQDGSESVAAVTDTVKPGESNTYFPVHAADGFNGSVVIESNVPIAVISNILYVGNPSVQASWSGFSAGASVIRFPLIMKGNNSNYTTFNVQNITGSPVSILIEFTAEPGAGYGAIANVSDTIPAYSAHTYDQNTMTEFAGVAKWVGSAKVSVQGTGEIVGVAQQLDTARKTGTAYNSFLVGSATVDMPLIMKENNNMWTSINCQNLGPGATDVTVNFVPESGYPALAPETKTAVAENGTAVFIQYGGEKWVGAATVSNSAGNQLACIGNQTNLVKFYASAYEGFEAAMATAMVNVPLVQFQPQDDGALWTSINIKNLGATATTVTVDFKPAPGFADVANYTVDIEAGAVGVVLFYDPYGTGAKAIGGAKVSSGNAMSLAVVANQQKVNYAGDIYSTYNGFSE